MRPGAEVVREWAEAALARGETLPSELALRDLADKIDDEATVLLERTAGPPLTPEQDVRLRKLMALPETRGRMLAVADDPGDEVSGLLDRQSSGDRREDMERRRADAA